MLRGSAKRQERVLMTIGAAVVLSIALAVALIVVNPFGGRPKGEFSVAITTPYVGQGVEVGTAVVLNGVKVGQVTSVDSIDSPSGGVRLLTDLQRQPVEGITDKMNIDFRPINYFGVPGINLVPNPGGQALRDGSEVNLLPKGNFTLSQLLSQLGDVAAASLTPQIIQVIDKATQYTDGLNPLVETAVTVTRAIEATQTVSPELQLANLSTAIAAFPPFTKEVIVAGTRFINFDYYPGQKRNPATSAGPKLQFPFLEDEKVENLNDMSADYFKKSGYDTTDFLANGLFASVGKLLSTHVDDLFPLISGLKSITDIGPVLLRPQDVAQKLAELRSRFTKLYEGNGQQRAIQVRILLDSLPGVAAPLGVVAGGPQ